MASQHRDLHAKDHVGAMASLIGSPLRWNKCILLHGSVEEEREKPFFRWLVEGDNEPPLEMNCWEVVLYSAWLAGLMTRADIVKWIDFEGQTSVALVRRLLQEPEQMIQPGEHGLVLPTDLVIPAGFIVLFGDDGHHVALAAGAGQEVLELDHDTAGVQRSQVRDILANKPDYTGCLSWGPLPQL